MTRQGIKRCLHFVWYHQSSIHVTSTVFYLLWTIAYMQSYQMCVIDLAHYFNDHLEKSVGLIALNKNIGKMFVALLTSLVISAV
jgi:predicted MFS family arabinose efflux permease